MKRRTIRNKVSRKGKGLHTGEELTVSILPNPEPKGILFWRSDLAGDVYISADINNVNGTNRNTMLAKGDHSISTVEHILSALFANGIHDVIIEVNGPEVPVFDGSASTFVEMIHEAGIQEVEGEVNHYIVDDEMKFLDEDSGSEYIILPAEKFEITALVDFPDTNIGFQYASLDNLEEYNVQIAKARTFVKARDLLRLSSENLIKGGTLSNALVLGIEDMSKEQLSAIAKSLGREEIQLNREGKIGDQEWTSSNEPARHKLLDLIGDLALVGAEIKGKIIAKKPGHRGNTAFAAFLKKKYQEYKKVKGVPKYDPNVPPIIDTQGVINMLPHRYPFLLVDKIIELTDNVVVGVKNITFNEEFFQGHFPGNPIFPGVLQMEALAQTGGILALYSVGEPALWDTYFLKMDKVKFKNKVVPGDTLILKMELLSPIRRGIVQMQGTAYVGNKIVSEGELVAQIIKRDK